MAEETQMRRCSICEVIKPLDAFHRRRHYSRDGRRAACKDCTAKIAKTKAWYGKHAWAEKEAVREQTRKAIRNGELTPQPCAYCGDETVEAHHVRYEGEGAHLDVEWLCEKHHSLIHGKRSWTKQLELFEKPRTGG